jgi:hypothetical protein
VENGKSKMPRTTTPKFSMKRVMFQNPSSKYRGGKPCDGGDSTLESKNPDDAAPYPSYENGIVVHKMGKTAG